VAAILIHRCSVRLVRRHGWSWGEDPQRLVRSIVRDRPALLAERLAALFPEEEDRELSAPVRLRIPVHIGELSGRAAAVAEAPRGEVWQPSASFGRQLDASLRAAFELGAEAVRETYQTGRFAQMARADAAASSDAGTVATGALQRLLLDWVVTGVLEERLARISAMQIDLWHQVLLRQTQQSSGADDRTEPGFSERIDAWLRTRAPTAVTEAPTDRLRHRIVLAATVAAQLDVPLTQPSLWQAVDRRLPVEPPPAPAPHSSMREAASGQRDAWMRVAPQILPQSTAAAPAKPERPRHPGPGQDAAWEVKIDCALPFLLLGPLARLGYITALDAVLEGAELTGEASIFGAALAYKVLDPPERGWRRSSASVLAAATFAGWRDPVAEEALVDFSRRVAPHLNVLDLVLAEAVIAGHTAGEPVVLRRSCPETDRAGLLLVDTPGSFPIASADGVQPLLPLLQRLPSPVVIVSREAAAPLLLNDLDRAGLTFVSDVPPTRHERWQRVQQGAARLGWTNSSAPASQPVVGAARKIPDACGGEAADLWQQLALTRPAVVRARMPELDRSVTLAAAVASGIIAWELSRKGRPIGPQKVIPRYCDLDARVRFDPAAVVVSLPLGRRHQELGEAGLLAPVSGVPWFGGRCIEFSGG
jgi:hypothetical protein